MFKSPTVEVSRVEGVVGIGYERRLLVQDAVPVHPSEKLMASQVCIDDGVKIYVQLLQIQRDEPEACGRESESTSSSLSTKSTLASVSAPSSGQGMSETEITTEKSCR